MKSTSLEVLVKPTGRPLTVKATFLPEPYNIKEKLWIRVGKRKRPGQKEGLQEMYSFPSVSQSYDPATERKNQMKNRLDVVE